MEEVINQLTFKKPVELDLEDKLFKLISILQNPDLYEKIKKKNPNVEPYIEML